MLAITMNSCSTVVTQGGIFGSLKCSNSIDTIGKKCVNSGKHLFTYKKMVKIMPLSMVDDILAVSRCSDSLAVNFTPLMLMVNPSVMFSTSAKKWIFAPPYSGPWNREKCD